MIEVEVNLVGVAAATVVAMVIGAVWYSKGVFGKEWIKLAGVDEKRAQKEAPHSMAVMAVLAAVQAYVMAYLTYIVGAVLQEESFSTAAIKTALIVWVGFALPMAAGAMFEQRRKKLIVINLGNSLVTFLAMGIAIGAVGL